MYMVMNTMDQQEHCHGCTQKSRCQEVYEKMGNIQGGSIVLKVMSAFLLPILVFIGCLAAFEGILSKMRTSQEVQTWVGLLLALLVTFVCILITRVLNRSIIKHR
jgi:hypothetical protein